MILRGTLWFLFGMLIVHVTMAVLFIVGFFLSKTELLLHSQCNQYPLQNTSSAMNDSSPYNIDYNEIFKSLGVNDTTDCWSSAKYDKVIILIVDALKFDFVSPWMEQQQPKDIDVLYYSHRLSSIHNLLLNTSYHSKLFKFISDPPTVTAQRIKGFTSGGLPTFFDIRNSFTSQRIVVDNILYQLKMNGRYNISFMGDDTWNKLFDFELYFGQQNYPYPSFDVYDLYTVDNGCKKHLYDALYTDKLNQWDVLISHFLGVDHVGHRYHMNHPQMADKLNEMNDIMHNVTDWIQSYKKDNPNKDVLLLLFGDHGMTATGDHGGATSDETNAALFMHSTKYLYPYDPFRNDNDYDRYRAVTQINIVPTISLLMGIPIPFENIGAIIPEFYLEMNQHRNIMKHNPPNVEMDATVWFNSWRELLKAMSLNVFQVYQYLYTYNRDGNSDTFSDSELKQLNDQLMDGVRDLMDLKPDDREIQAIKPIVRKFQTFLKEAYTLCRHKWTTFNLHTMAVAICIGVFAVIGLLSMALDMNSSDSIQECDITLMIWTKLNLYFDVPILIVSASYIKYFFYADYLWSNVFISAQVLCYSMGCNFVLSLCRQYMSCTVDWIDTFHTFDCIALVLMVIAYFQGLFTDTYIKYEPQLVLCLLISALVMMIVSNFRQHHDIDRRFRERVRRGMIYMIPIALCIRWMGIASLNEMEPDYAWLTTVNKRFWIMKLWSYVSVILPTFAIPLILFALYYRFKLLNPVCMMQCVLSLASESLLLSYWFMIGDESFLRGDSTYQYLWLFPPLIWALFVLQLVLWCIQIRTQCIERRFRFMMISLIQLWIAMNPSLCLVLGANSHMILIYGLICVYCFTRVETPMTRGKHLAVIHSYELWIGWLLYQYLFFVTGHRCTFSKISWKTAFIGGVEYNYIRAAILSIVHEFSGHLFAFLVIPILIFSRLAMRNYHYDMDLLRVVACVKYNICKYVYASMIFSTLFVLCSMCNCYMHRRHLLVWDIFAPKIIFDMAHVLIIDILSMLYVVLVALILANLTQKHPFKLV